MTSKKCIWKNHIAAWENSDLSQAEYCRKHGLSVMVADHLDS
ncbi:IS66 family insertion sequence element accessory protein TnpA [Maridesulfovibrio ferrireducens]